MRRPRRRETVNITRKRTRKQRSKSVKKQNLSLKMLGMRATNTKIIKKKEMKRSWLVIALKQKIKELEEQLK